MAETKPQGVTEPKIDPLLTAMLDRLAETAPAWREDARELWCSLFVATVSLVYPCKPKRKSRAKKDRP